MYNPALPEVREHVSVPGAYTRIDGQSPMELLAAATQILGDRRLLNYPGCAQLEILDSAQHPDTAEANPTIVWFAEMGQALDGAANASNLYRLSVIRQQFPDHRFIVVGLPDGSESATRFVSPEQRQAAAEADFSPFHIPLVQYLHDTGAWSLLVGGCSGGAEIGADFLRFLTAPNGELGVPEIQAVGYSFVEAPGIRERSALGLGFRFLKAVTGVGRYVQGADDVYKLALHMQKPLLPYIASMLHPDNRAIAHGYARAKFAEHLAEAIDNRPGLHGVVAWGTATEFGPRKYVEAASNKLALLGAGRVEVLDFDSDRHALCRDAVRIARVALRAFSPLPDA